MFEFYNPHPNQKIVGDCVKRALTKVSGRSYQEVSNELNRIKRQQGASAYNCNSVWKAYLTDELNTSYVTYPAVKGQPRMNGKRFCESHPVGTYVLNMAGHLSSCVDGVIYDTWDCSEKCVYGSYEIHTGSGLALDEDEVITRSCEPASDPENLNVYHEAPKLIVKELRMTGNALISKYAEMTGCSIEYTKENEWWIPLTKEAYDMVHKDLLSMNNLRCKTRSNSLKSKWMDDETGMVLILKSGDNPYVWCIEDGVIK